MKLSKAREPKIRFRLTACSLWWPAAQALSASLLISPRHEADTRDLLQELFIKLAQRPELLDGVRDERAFLLRLAHNLAIDLLRRRGTREKNYEQLAGETLAVFAPTAAPDEVAFREALA